MRERSHQPETHPSWIGSFRALPHEFRRFLSGVGIAGLGDFSKTLLILWAAQAFTPERGPERAAALAMLLYVGYNVVYTGSCYLSGWLADHLSKKWILATGYALAVIPAVALAVVLVLTWRMMHPRTGSAAHLPMPAPPQSVASRPR